jgi:hypothetical protein
LRRKFPATESDSTFLFPNGFANLASAKGDIDMSGSRELVCASCDWIGSPPSPPDECPNCGLPADEVLSPTGADSDDPPDNEEFSKEP